MVLMSSQEQAHISQTVIFICLIIHLSVSIWILLTENHARYATMAITNQWKANLRAYNVQPPRIVHRMAHKLDVSHVQHTKSLNRDRPNAQNAMGVNSKAQV
tara:strand:- start:1140 stop:1445 length:306 start_codon:yes stop_codon:yes gene_type:complete